LSPFAEPIWPKDTKLNGIGLPTAAYAPDGKTIYFTGYAGVPPKGQAKHDTWPDGRVYKMEVSSGKAQPFVDVPLPEKAAVPLQAWHVSGNVLALHGLTTDKAGHVFMCDAAGGKVWVYSADGKSVGSVDVPGAYVAAVDEKTGALYVLTRQAGGYQVWKKSLVKLSGWKAGAKVIDTADLPRQGRLERSLSRGRLRQRAAAALGLRLSAQRESAAHRGRGRQAYDRRRLGRPCQDGRRLRGPSGGRSRGGPRLHQ
jgi:hypothetical protein